MGTHFVNLIPLYIFLGGTLGLPTGRGHLSAEAIERQVLCSERPAWALTSTFGTVCSKSYGVNQAVIDYCREMNGLRCLIR